MTSRERPASGGATLAPRPAPSSLARPGSGPSIGSRDTPVWEDLFLSASPAVQDELLRLADQQGLLYLHRLPPSDANGSAQRRQFLPNLLAGKVRELTPRRPEPITLLDADLDSAQGLAVGRALTTPDLCLIQGRAGSGKSRVVAEIVRQSAARGERVLLLAPTPAALDRVLELLGPRDDLCPVRCLGLGETLDSLPPAVRALTFAERIRDLSERATRAARGDAEATRQRLAVVRDESSAWEALDALAARETVLTGKRAGLEQRRASVPEEVARSADSGDDPGGADTFLGRTAAANRQRDEERKTLREKRGTVQAGRAALRDRRDPLQIEFDDLTHVIEVGRSWRIWSPAWWRCLGKSAVLQGRRDEVKNHLDELEREDASLADQEGRLAEEEKRSEEAYRQCRQQLLDEETARRIRELDGDAADLEREGESVRREWEEVCGRLSDPSTRLGQLSANAVAEARVAWQSLLTRTEERAEFARQWAECLEEAAQTWPARLEGCANLVAATTSALAADPHFGDGAGDPATFDLLLLEEADRIAEADFLTLARRARRWVLIGEPTPPVQVPTDHGPPSRRAGPRPTRPVVQRTGFFQRLWDQLHPSPRRLAYQWARTADRLSCRLRVLSSEEERWVECEPVADRADIELCIAAPPRGEPFLTEVRFPAQTPIGLAKEYLYRELQEVTARCPGEAAVWVEEERCVRLATGPLPPCGQDAPGVVTVPLGAGIEEFVREVANGNGKTTFETLGFRFDRSSGWTPQTAEEWAGKHLSLHDHGRTALLDRCHRAAPALAAALHEAFTGEVGCAPAQPETAWHGWANGLEFVPVPAPSGDPRKRAHSDGRRPPDGTNRSRGKPGGAGLETDLADRAAVEMLPPEVRTALPSMGLVNYPEAVAVVQAVEGLVGDPAFRARAANWQRQHPTLPALVVTATTAAQAVLLQHLLARSRTLEKAGLARLAPGRFQLPGGNGAIEVRAGAPEDMRQRECLGLLLSLTRSHTHRAVAFGDRADWLRLCLTRARDRVVVFGDAGTLARRTQWPGAVDHLDEHAAARERELLERLVRFWQRQPACAAAFPAPAEGSA